MIETVEDLLDELIKYSMDTKILFLLREDDLEPGLKKIWKINPIKIEHGLHLEVEVL